MSYVNYNQSLYRTGFRPYGKSDPHAANQLEGYPFTETGGQMLHGLGQMVPDQSLVTYVGRWHYITGVGSGFGTPKAVIDQVTNALANDGLIVRSASSDASITQEAFGNPYTVTLQILVNNGMGFGSPHDLASIVNHEVYAATGKMPISGDASLSVLPTEGIAPAVVPPGSLPPTDWGKWFQDNATWLAIGVVAVAVLPTLLKKLL